jgi:hypothetical protein
LVSGLSQKPGFDLAPLAGLIAPMVGQHFAKTAKEQGLDATGFARMLQSGNDEFQKDPANAEALRARFTPHELEEVHIAPLAAYCLVAKASPSGIKGSMDEMKAAPKVSIDLLKDMKPISQLGTVFGGGLTSGEAEELKREVEAEERLIGTIRAGTAVVKSKAPAEVDTFRRLVNDVARNVAEASKEGGFLGFGGRKVSDKEKTAMARDAAALV